MCVQRGAVQLKDSHPFVLDALGGDAGAAAPVGWGRGTKARALCSMTHCWINGVT